jgi:aerobic-type carbon monoxide dehydrogenase small subunit (CoxS/CutS family)
MLMSVACAMNAGHHGSNISDEVKNLCFCGTYPRIRQAGSKL